jgi:hypothetical protein
MRKSGLNKPLKEMHQAENRDLKRPKKMPEQAATKGLNTAFFAPQILTQKL